MAQGLSIWSVIAAALGGPTTQIYNGSGKYIFLIPISCRDDYNPRENGKVADDDKLAKVIEPKATIQVDSRKYDYNDRHSNSQIHILFRTVDHDKVKTFLVDLKNENPHGIKVKQGEKLFFHFDLLGCRKLSLKCNEEGQVHASNTPKQSDVVDLIKQMQDDQKELEEKVKALQGQMKTLRDDFDKLSNREKI